MNSAIEPGVLVHSCRAAGPAPWQDIGRTRPPISERRPTRCERQHAPVFSVGIFYTLPCRTVAYGRSGPFKYLIRLGLRPVGKVLAFIRFNPADAPGTYKP
jgi:hypothetical protein